MPRYVVYKAARGSARAQAYAAETTGSPDSYVSKIAKYVPAETISIASLFFANFSPRGGWLWFTVGVGAILNIAYLFSIVLVSKGNDPGPRVYYYILSAFAFALWSLASINAVASAAGLTNGQRAVVLALTTFFIPAADTILSAVRFPGARPKWFRSLSSSTGT